MTRITTSIDVIADLLDEIARRERQLVERSGWISVDERLPEIGKSVLACNALGYFGRVTWDGKRWNHIGKPTHWKYVVLPSTKGEPT